MILHGKRVLLGISGGIAAYKMAHTVRLLKKLGAEVRCIMTPASCDFITPLTLSTLSQHPVAVDFYVKETGAWHNHVEWGEWADVFLIAPATANTLAKMAHGFSDNFLLATFLSARCQVMIAPAMDLDMYQHPTTKRNFFILEQDGHIILPAESGFLASGLSGQGRLPEPETLVTHVTAFLLQDEQWKNRKVLITAGPTYEAIDPVRFIGNHASGKMGIALAEAAANKGAQVELVLGPTHLTIEHPKVTVNRIQSAEEMLKVVQSVWSSCTHGIFAAAVADYRPKIKADQKIKKGSETAIDSIELVENPDILKWASQNRTTQKVIGFALETTNGEAFAKQKLQNKNLDAIVLNELGEPGVGFGTDTNKVQLIAANNKMRSFELLPKSELAYALLDAINEI